MPVINTNQWLKKWYHQPIAICERLTAYFKHATANQIYEYLRLHGMYHPHRHGQEQVANLQNNKVWEIVEKDFQALRKLWNGPDVPVFIFPVDSSDRKIQRDMNGKSGLAFKDKLFLFLSEQNTDMEIQALLTHEYNHVCRLTKYSKKEADYVLLDAVILEGLAETAVNERIGEKYLAKWTSYYTEAELDKMWDTLIKPNRNIANSDRRYQPFLYGTRQGLPNMLGYCVGYHLVKKYKEKSGLLVKDMLPLKTENIALAIYKDSK